MFALAFGYPISVPLIPFNPNRTGLRNLPPGPAGPRRARTLSGGRSGGTWEDESCERIVVMQESKPEQRAAMIDQAHQPRKISFQQARLPSKTMAVQCLSVRSDSRLFNSTQSHASALMKFLSI
eukprot:754594-Hanusia_phi.AAC.1